MAFLDSAQNLALKKVRSEIDQDLDTSTIMVQAKYGTRATKLVLSDYCTYSRVPNKHDGMFIYSACKNPVRHAYCGRHAANDTLPMTRSCPLHTSMCSVSPQFVPVYSEDIVKPLVYNYECYGHRWYGTHITLAPVLCCVLGQHGHDTGATRLAARKEHV